MYVYIYIFVRVFNDGWVPAIHGPGFPATVRNFSQLFFFFLEEISEQSEDQFFSTIWDLRLNSPPILLRLNSTPRRFPSCLLLTLLKRRLREVQPGAPYRIFLLFLPCLPCHFYLDVIGQLSSPKGSFQAFLIGNWKPQYTMQLSVQLFAVTVSKNQLNA